MKRRASTGFSLLLGFLALAATSAVPASGATPVAAPAAGSQPVSFRNDVMPVLTRVGCNQGACHGAEAGKGGFRLSLLGYDPEADYRAITREGNGRRVVRSQPEASLLLRKARMQLPHGGGLRLAPGSSELAVLSGWLAEGAPGLVEGERHVERLAVTPPAPLLRVGQRASLQVTATYSDGSSQDVTGRALYTTNDEAVAGVDPSGSVRGAGPGATTIVARYQGQVATARVTSPFAQLKRYPALPQRNLVDHHLQVEWRRLGLLPSRMTSDAEFVRRVYLDTIGTLPTPEEVNAFLRECEAERREEMRKRGNEEMAGPAGTFPHFPISSFPPANARERLVDRLLDRPEWVEYWSLYFGDIFRNNREVIGAKAMWAFRGWIQSSLREGKPYNQMVRELIGASGSAFRNGAANYYAIAQTPEELAETTSQLFLGVRIQCTKCHNHPFERWTMDDYYGFAAFFARVQRKGRPQLGAQGSDFLILPAVKGEVKHPKTGVPVAPKLLNGAEVGYEGDPRQALAAWLSAPENPYTARTIVNRIWARLMGRGLIEPVDDVRSSNPPTHPELLDALIREFIAANFNLKRLMRTVLTSAAYQLASDATKQNAKDDRFYSHYRVRRLTAEQLLDAICDVTGVPEPFEGLPASFRAISLPDPKVRVPLLDTFGRPERVAVCECERSVDSDLSQTLYLINSEFLQGKLAAPGGRITALLKAGKSDEAILTELYARAFSRPPSASELASGRRFVSEAATRQEGLEDVLWALLNSGEFVLQH